MLLSFVVVSDCRLSYPFLVLFFIAVFLATSSNPDVRFRVVGASLGGYLALTLAKKYPKVIESTVALCPAVNMAGLAVRKRRGQRVMV